MDRGRQSVSSRKFAINHERVNKATRLSRETGCNGEIEKARRAFEHTVQYLVALVTAGDMLEQYAFRPTQIYAVHAAP